MSAGIGLILLGIDNAQATTNHLDHGGFVGTWAQQHDTTGWRMVPTFRKHGHVYDDADFIRGVSGEDVLALLSPKITMDDCCRNLGSAKCTGDIFGMCDR